MKAGVDYIGVGIGAVILREGKIFLAQRGPDCRNERGLWETPGGAHEFGHQMRDTIKREIGEEFGITIEVGAQLHSYDHIVPEENQHWLAVSYLCTILEGEPTIKEERKCSGIGFFTFDEAWKLPLTLTALEDLQALALRFPDKILV